MIRWRLYVASKVDFEIDLQEVIINLAHGWKELVS